MPRMLDLRDVLQLVIYRLNYRSIAQYQLVLNRYQLVFYVFSDLGN